MVTGENTETGMIGKEVPIGEIVNPVAIGEIEKEAPTKKIETEMISEQIINKNPYNRNYQQNNRYQDNNNNNQYRDNREKRSKESAPHEHQQNGQVERYVTSMEEQVTSMRAAAQWVPKKFITQQIPLWALVWNLQSGVHIHKSRVEQFTGRRPSINLNDLPGAWGDCFVVHEPKDKRTERFDPHARGPVMYLGPNTMTKDAHYFYDPIIRKVLTRRRYRRIAGVPKEWTQQQNQITQQTTELPELVETGSDRYDTWQRGASIQVTGSDLLDLPIDLGGGQEERRGAHRKSLRWRII